MPCESWPDWGYRNRSENRRSGSNVLREIAAPQERIVRQIISVPAFDPFERFRTARPKKFYDSKGNPIMPCQSDDTGEYQNEINELTRTLCDVNEFLKQSGLRDKAPKRFIKWARQHEREDREREREDAAFREERKARKSAAKKLTAAERRALGI